MINCPDASISSKVKCAICRSEIKDRHQMYQTHLSFGVVCRECFKRFSQEDIEMIANLFLAYGGYFGQYERDALSIESLIIKFAQKINLGTETLASTNIKMWHEVLTHGITPKEFLTALKEYIE
jgi:hypothetical protein